MRARGCVLVRARVRSRARARMRSRARARVHSRARARVHSRARARVRSRARVGVRSRAWAWACVDVRARGFLRCFLCYHPLISLLGKAYEGNGSTKGNTIFQ